jgi:hypothetical protein
VPAARIVAAARLILILFIVRFPLWNGRVGAETLTAGPRNSFSIQLLLLAPRPTWVIEIVR